MARVSRSAELAFEAVEAVRATPELPLSAAIVALEQCPLSNLRRVQV